MSYIPQAGGNIDPVVAQPDACYGTDKHGVLAVFHYRPVQDDKQTKFQGRPVFESVAYVKILVPGDSRSVVCERLNDLHKARWPHVWEAFQKERVGAVGGTPIEEFPLLNAVQVATLRAMGILTVEQLANVADSKLHMGLPRELRDRARQWLQGDDDTIKELRKENTELKDEVARLTARLDIMAKSLERLGVQDPEEAPAGALTAVGRKLRKAKNGTEARA